MANKLDVWVSMETLNFETKQRDQVIAEKEAYIQSLINDLERYKRMLDMANINLGKMNLKHQRLLETLEALIRSEHETC